MDTKKKSGLELIEDNEANRKNFNPLRNKRDNAHCMCKDKRDFLKKILSFTQSRNGVDVETETYWGRAARLRLQFVSEAAFRVQMFPLNEEPVRLNEVFSFRPYEHISVEEDAQYLLVSTSRVQLKIRKFPFEMIVFLDGEELTKEQVNDYDVGRNYKAAPIGFTVDENNRVSSAFESMYMYSDESFYGFGEKFTDFDKRGQKITVWQQDAQSTNSDISYKGMPYFMSSGGYSILLNTYTRSHFNMGATSGVSYTMETEDPYLDYYMFCNRDYKGLLADYTALSGRSEMVPRWSFGFWMSKMSYMNREEIKEIVTQMDAFGMSVDVIHIDAWLDLMSENGGPDLLAFDLDRFPDPEDMIIWLKERGIHLSLWMFPYVVAKAAWGRSQELSALYVNMRNRGFLVKNPQGDPYLFAIDEGGFGKGYAALDFTNPEAVAYIKSRVKRLMKMGVGVIKTDFSEEIPEDAVFFDGSIGLQSHNKFTLLYAKTIYEASREAKEEMGERALLWGRSGFAGSQNYPANWAGDSSASENNLSCILKGGLSIGISGVSFWGFDIGGFYSYDFDGNRTMPQDDEYIRSSQMGLMSPLSRSHGQATPREPWKYSKKTQKAFLKINKLRYRLLPYIYSTAYETHRQGLPMMRAMLLEFQEDLNTRDISTQYMLGGSLLVAPVFDQKEHRVYLPTGDWVDFYSGRRHKGPRWITVEKDIMTIPLFIRPNSAIPMLQEAPMHIEDQNFADLAVVMNLTDELEHRHYDDGVEAVITAKLEEDMVNVTIREADVGKIVMYLPCAVKKAIVNQQEWTVEEAGNAYIIHP